MKFEKLPHHLAIIPDGNRRWAKTNVLPSSAGHREGYKRTKELIEESKALGISCVTIWAFSTENWKRKTEEKEELFSVIKQGLVTLCEESLDKKSRFVHLGRKDRLGGDLLGLISQLEEETKDFNSFTLCVAIDYGGEDEILRAHQAYINNSHEDEVLTDYLDTSRNKIPSPDLIIRTSGEKRTSGFMPLQSVYSEWYFSEKCFPDFDIKELHCVLKEYESRKRRYGK